ncbi:MAG: SUMF1/EgtB/PvdO family nonheme iron enzyme [Bacteroidales bacterium]|nr:SUMF1/EgtB/PvdO family nonheme iron enzyme [Bacteroidales bacterium]
MKKILSFCIFLSAVASFQARAQELTVKDFHADPLDASASIHEVKDLNGEACALLKLGLVLMDVNFEGDIVKTEYKDGEWWLYMLNGATWLNVKSRKYLPLRYEFPKLEKRVTYIMQVEVPRTEVKGPKGKMEITSNLRDVDVYIDGEKMSSILPFVYEGGDGEHSLELRAEGYNSEKSHFTIQLRRKGNIHLDMKQKGSIYIDGVSYEMVRFPGGKFKIGSLAKKSPSGFNYSQPAHNVSLRPFRIGKTEVTQALWMKIMGSNPSLHPGEQLPVDNVSWWEVLEFIERLNKQCGTNFRLPTEAEWEFAARYCGAGQPFSQPDAWSGDGGLEQNAVLGVSTARVASRSVNRAGVHDMSGNVAEWCSDWLSKYGPEDQVNPSGPSTGLRKVVRGGAYCDDKLFLNTSYRGHEKPDNTSSRIGFRLASDD